MQELELLKSRLDIAMRGHGQVVGILGVPGIGKTRLLAEFRRALQGVEVTYLEGQCRSYGSTTPYLPVLDILRYNFRITEADTPEVIVEKVRGALQELAMDPGEWAPYLLHLLDVRRVAESLANVSPGAVKARTFEALRLMCLNGSRRRPIVFVIEDLHWVDATTEECLLSLMESAAHARAMFIGTYRPGYRTPWVDRSYASQIALQPLSDGDSLSIVRSLLPRGEISEDIARLILDKAEGNPYFLEELSREVGEAGGSRVRAPETVQEVILGRLDRLSEGAKRLLQTASVLGREVPLALLKELWAPASGLDAHLHELAKSELLSAHGGVEQRYAFAHTLTQEVVYESLSLPRRQALHAAAARALEQIHTNRREEVYDRLGYHYSRAGQSAQAVEYLTRMAEKAAFANAHSEAVGVLDEALSHVDRFPEAERGRQRLELVLRQAASLVYLGRFQDIVDLLLRHEGDLQASQDTQLIGQYHFLIARSYLFLGDDARAAQHAERAIAEATRSGDESTLGKVHYVLAQHGALTGRFEEGLQHGQQAAALLERAGQGWWIGPAHWAVGLNLALRGEFEAALEAEARATSIATVVGDPQLLSSASWATGVIQTAMGEWEAGVAACQRALDRSPDPLDTALALGWLGFAHVERGEPVQAIPLLEQAVRELAQFKFPQPQGWFTVFLAEAHRLAGRLETAIGLAAQGLRIARESGSPYGVGLARRALGRATQTKGALTEAESHLQGARETFASTSAQYDAARTHLDLAALAYARADRIAVAGHLRQARDLFTVMRAARYVARADELAAQFGVSLT